MAKASAAAKSTPASDVPHIVERAPKAPKKPERNLAGRYRLIHGTMSIPRPKSETHNPDGTRKENEELQTQAQPGDVVYLPQADAKSALLHGVVEDLDASPSRVGRVFEKDEAHDNSKQAKARVAQHLHPAVRGMQASAD